MTIALNALLLAASMMHLPHPQSLSSAPKVQHKKSDCTNFSGNWLGKCLESGDTSEYVDHTVIFQDDCDSINIDNNNFSFGGSYSIGQTNGSDGFLYSGLAYLDWNSSLSAVRMRADMSGRIQAQDSFFSGHSIMDITLVNGQLITRQNSSYESETLGRVTTTKHSAECTYDKTP